jgi:hypothetical protein
MTDFIVMTADEAVKLRGGDTKVLVCTDEEPVNAFSTIKFAECEELIKDGEQIQYLLNDFIEQLRVRSLCPRNITTTILLPPGT